MRASDGDADTEARIPMTPATGSLRITLASAHDRAGGAATAAARLRDGLLAAGHRPRLFVQNQAHVHPATVGPRGGLQRTFNRMRSDIDSLPLRLRAVAVDRFSVSWLPRVAPSLSAAGPSDLVHLHWTNAGFLSIGDIGRIDVPVVWTLHDMWSFTGGCQYDDGCERFTMGCGECPLLRSTRRSDLSSRRFALKQRRWRERDITVVSPSRWLAAAARRSAVFDGKRIDVICNGVDTQRFKPLDRGFARTALGLPLGTRLVLFGAMNAGSDPRKGYDLLEAALAHLAAQASGKDDTALVVFGANPPREERVHGLRSVHVGHLNDDISLALLYAACDVMVVPSRQENLPNTVAEAMACGTPCVAFDIGGLPDLIDHGRSGYLARPFDPADLAAGIAWCLDDKDARWSGLCDAARQAAVERVELTTQTQRYVSLYRQLLISPRPRHD